MTIDDLDIDLEERNNKEVFEYYSNFVTPNGYVNLLDGIKKEFKLIVARGLEQADDYLNWMKRSKDGKMVYNKLSRVDFFERNIYNVVREAIHNNMRVDIPTVIDLWGKYVNSEDFRLDYHRYKVGCNESDAMAKVIIVFVSKNV